MKNRKKYSKISFLRLFASITFGEGSMMWIVVQELWRAYNLSDRLFSQGDGKEYLHESLI